ncbi:SDR family oxidoreductase [uncultured Streptococcus sp.]|uniref:SDR family oxidoreductase n=1 Tax=uncultured Streptococcus sp. TaxID=83427 RepID=UPI0025CE1FF3|nr:SDR family oxidoreductase [uncultured Streptococcus sp.]
MGVKSVIKRIIQSTKEKEVVPIPQEVDINQSLDGKVAVIIGGSGGIGLSIAKNLNKNGCKIILCGTNAEKLEKSLEGFSNPSYVFPMVFNIANTETIEENVKKTFSIFRKVDILINSAGVHTENVDFFTMTPDEFDRVMNINIKGVYFVCREFAKEMKQRPSRSKRHMLLVSSSRGAEPAWSPYGLSKWSLNGLTQGLAQLLLPDGIIVNSIAPGSTATDLIGVKEGDNIFSWENGNKRLVMPDEVSNVARLLVSSSGDMIVGQTIYVSGGRGVFDIR